MSSLLDKIRGSDYMQSQNEFVMGRLEWLNHLSLVFNLTLNCPLISPSSASVTTEAFLNTLIENFTNLPLVSRGEFETRTKVKFVSFKEIFGMFEDDFGKVLDWDKVMEKVVGFDAQGKRHRRGGSDSPGSIDLNELVFISKLSNSSVDCETEQKRKRLSDLRIPLTPLGIDSSSFIAVTGNYTPSPRESQDFSNKTSLKFPEIGSDLFSIVKLKSQSMEKLNLSCKKLSIIDRTLPNTLMQLNISHNHLEKIPNIDHLEQLEYLDVSWNFLTNLNECSGSRTLRELYLAHNKIDSTEGVQSYENIVIFDISFNKVLNLSGLAPCLALKALKVLDLEGNPLTTLMSWKEKVINFIPHVSNFDNKRISEFTHFPSRPSRKQQSKFTKFSRNKSKK